jgi:3D (Asp-Asp-Asp) domain-containing protein
MLIGKKLMCLTLLPVFIAPSTLTTFPSAMQIIEKQVDNKEVVYKINKFGLINNPILEKFEKDRIEYEKNKQAEEEKIRKQKEIEETKKNEPQWQEFILTFYTSLQCENSSAGSVTSQGKKLSRGGVANNIIPQNTKIYLDKWGQVTVNDKGSSRHFSVDNRLDVYIEKEHGESDDQYLKRVNSYGVQRVRGYIIQ